LTPGQYADLRKLLDDARRARITRDDAALESLRDKIDELPGITEAQKKAFASATVIPARGAGGKLPVEVLEKLQAASRDDRGIEIARMVLDTVTKLARPRPGGGRPGGGMPGAGMGGGMPGAGMGGGMPGAGMGGGMPGAGMGAGMPGAGMGGGMPGAGMGGGMPGAGMGGGMPGAGMGGMPGGGTILVVPIMGTWRLGNAPIIILPGDTEREGWIEGTLVSGVTGYRNRYLWKAKSMKDGHLYIETRFGRQGPIGVRLISRTMMDWFFGAEKARLDKLN
jgi:hypothetical protein